MKSFKRYIKESTFLMDLINKYDDPFSFLAAAMDAIADGTLKLKTRGLANARELVAAWNKSKKRKIKLGEAVDYLTEASKGFVKGWVHKSGTITDTTIYGKYHIMQVATNLRKFGLNKNKMLKIISDAYPDSNEGWPEDLLDDLQTGRVDNDPYIEEYLQEKGWCMFVIDKTHGSISGWDERSTKPAAKALDDKYLPYETRKDLKLFEVKLANGKDNYITSKFDWYLWLDGKKVADNRTDIGSTMAQFRDEKEIDMKSFNQHIAEGTQKTLVVSFESKISFEQRIYELDMKQNFRKFVVLPAKRTNRGFDITFNGEERELEKIVEYITLKLDRNNKLYHSHTIK
jgi:hypothetical protein